MYSVVSSAGFVPGSSVSLEGTFHSYSWLCLSVLVGWVKQFGSGTSEAFGWKLLFPTLAFAAIEQKHSNLMCACSCAIAVMQI